MFTQFLNKMTETQRTKIESLLDSGATLEQLLSEPEIVSESKWETASGLKD
jgi:hypothetical protein